MNLVALADETAGLRAKLVPMLSLPLDSQRFQKAFSLRDLNRHDLSDRSTYGDLKERSAYADLQAVARRQAEELGRTLGVPTAPMYFVMLWRDRLDGPGGNLFTASPLRG